MKRFTFLAVFFILGALAFSAEVGEKTYKEVTVNGKTLSKLVEVYSVIEYDSNENWIHYKASNGEEYWYEYTYWKNGKVKTKTEYHAL